jgi:hypothetical protein
VAADAARPEPAMTKLTATEFAAFDLGPLPAGAFAFQSDAEALTERQARRALASVLPDGHFVTTVRVYGEAEGVWAGAVIVAKTAYSHS